MSSKYDKIGNYNLSYELLKDATKEFDGYVLGLSQNDIWLFSDNLDKRSPPEPKDPDSKDEDLKNFLTELTPRILDRTTGTYFLINLLNAQNIANLKSHVNIDGAKLKQLMTFVPGYYPQDLAGGLFGATLGFDPVRDESGPSIILDNTDYKSASKLVDEIRTEANDDSAANYVSNDGGKTYQVFKASDPPLKKHTINDCLYYYNVLGIEKMVRKEP